MNTIKQKSAFVEIDGGKRIEVRRLRWRAMRDFLRVLAKVVTAVYPSTPPAPGSSWGAALFSKIPELVAGSDELVTILCTGSTNLTAEEFADLDGLVACEVIRASLAVNCDEEIKNSLAGIVGAVSGLMTTSQPEPIK
jgi:hypothetical protein